MRGVDAAVVLRTARKRAGLGLRDLARRAETSHATLRAYEQGSKVPRVDTLDRIVRAAGFDLAPDLARRWDEGEREARGRELVDALELAGAFPSRRARSPLRYPPFRPGR
jgi:transcriptional regulator with XRE-family HTH domain